MINCRKINDEKNIFEGIFSNKMFPIVWLIICAVQGIIIEFSSIVFEVNYGGQTWEHWLIAIILGLFSWVWDLILKFIPDKICPQFGKESKNPMEDEDHSVLSLRKKRSQSFSLRQPSGELYKEGSGRQGSGRQGSGRVQPK